MSSRLSFITKIINDGNQLTVRCATRSCTCIAENLCGQSTLIVGCMERDETEHHRHLGHVKLANSLEVNNV